MNDSWNLKVTANAQDFMSMAETLTMAPRRAHGSLPANDFAWLIEGSDLVDKGADVGLPYRGVAPDLGRVRVLRATTAAASRGRR